MAWNICPSRVVWVAEEDHFCAWSDNRCDLSRPHGKVIFRVGWDRNRGTPCKNNVCFVGYVSGVWRNHFIARVDNRSHCQIYTFTDTYCYQQLRPGIITEPVTALQHGSNLLAQFEQAII